ncbi:MAG: ferritin family protein [Pseudomonadota bacterium]
MQGRIEKNIVQAFGSETEGADRSAAFVLKAEQEGYPHLAGLFKAVSDAKSVHARRFRLLLRGKIGSTLENLEEALQRELKSVETEYPLMVEEARAGSKAVKKAFIQSRKTDAEVADLLKEALEGGKTGDDLVYYVCQICGHIHKDVVPDHCPVCRAVPGRFNKVGIKA